MLRKYRRAYKRSSRRAKIDDGKAGVRPGAVQNMTSGGVELAFDGLTFEVALKDGTRKKILSDVTGLVLGEPTLRKRERPRQHTVSCDL